MKFINAEFFYNSSVLIDDSKYSYWWFLMGIPSKSVGAIEEFSSYFESLKGIDKKTYKIISSTDVVLNNAYICGMLKAEKPAISVDDENPENRGKIMLTARSSDEDSIIPFTVGQDKKGDGHTIDSLWLVRLDKSIINRDEVLKFFPYQREGDTVTSTYIYSGVNDMFDIGKCKALIGYSVSASNGEIVNALNFSGFTVGNSTITISGLVDESVI